MACSRIALIFEPNQCRLSPTALDLCVTGFQEINSFWHVGHIMSQLLCSSVLDSHDDRKLYCLWPLTENPLWTAVNELKGIDPGPAWYHCYLVISPDTNTVSLPRSVWRCERGALKPPSLFAFPSKGLCEECWEFNWSLSCPGMAPSAPACSRSGNSWATRHRTPADHPAVGNQAELKRHLRKRLESRWWRAGDHRNSAVQISHDSSRNSPGGLCSLPSSLWGSSENPAQSAKAHFTQTVAVSRPTRNPDWKHLSSTF